MSFKEAVIQGLGPGKSLLFPEVIPTIESEFIQNLTEYNLHEIGYKIVSSFIENEIPEIVLRDIIKETLSFEIPLVEIENNIYSLELFHGPTCAFKDVGAKFLTKCLEYFTSDFNNETIVLVATSGDTGGAVANGLQNIKGLKGIILYPSDKISEIQEKQIAGISANVKAIKVKGTFDDCQRMVKSAFEDEEIKEKIILTSANSINIARLVPQIIYYFYAFSKLKNLYKPIAISVPSGNFGNLTAGLLAKKMGLPVEIFIASTNINKIVPDYLKSGIFEPKPSIETISNAMDVGNPNNFERILEIYQNDLQKIRKDVVGFYFSDKKTTETINTVFNKTKYILDPHGAVGYLGLKSFLQGVNDQYIGIFLETAHPYKFYDVLPAATKSSIAVPEQIVMSLDNEKRFITIDNDFELLRKFFLSGY